MSEVMSEVLNANVFVVSRKGKILGLCHCSGNSKRKNELRYIEEKQFPHEYTEGLLRIQETSANLDIDSPYSRIS